MDTIGKALGGPTGWILAGGLIYIAVQLWKTAKPAAKAGADLVKQVAETVTDIISNNTDLSYTGEPVGSSSTSSRISIQILTPKNGGSVMRSLIGNAVAAKIAINNPFEPRDLSVNVQATWYVSGGLVSGKITNVAATLKIPTGRTTWNVKLRVPTVVTFPGDEGVLEVYIGDDAVAVPASFTVM